jgi:hypothetical protein
MLTKELIESYKATSYRVPALNLDIHIGKMSPRLNEILNEYQAETWAFITAWNPESKLLTTGENKRRNKELRGKLKGYMIFDGIGIPENSDWTPEESYLVMGISKQQSTQLGRMFEQNAILFGKKFGLAKLIFCI